MGVILRLICEVTTHISYIVCSYQYKFLFFFRMALDDNHASVVLACVKVIQCLLSCSLNENFFDILEVKLFFSLRRSYSPHRT